MIHLQVYDLTRAKDECSSNLRALKEKRQFFSIFYDVNMNTKSKADGEFSRAFFGEIWQTGTKYFTIVEACFSGKSDKFAKIEETAFTNPGFFVSRRMGCAVKILRDDTKTSSLTGLGIKTHAKTAVKT